MQSLNVTHTTREGETCLIAQMETDHLLNTIRYQLRQLLDLKRSAQTPVKQTPLRKMLYHQPEPPNEEKVLSYIEAHLSTLQIYTGEAFLRLGEIFGIESLRNKYEEILQLYFEITERAQILPTLPKGRPVLTRDPLLSARSAWEDSKFDEYPFEPD